MASKQALNFIVPLVVYPFDVMVSVDQSDEAFKKSIGRYDIHLSDKGFKMNPKQTAFFIITSTNQSIIRIRRNVNRYELMGFIAHEIFHAVTFIMQRVGMKLKLLSSDEAYSYLVGYLTEQIFRKLKL